MTAFFSLNKELLEHLAQQTLILTPNRRMARHIRLGYSEIQNASPWLTPRVFSLDDWLLECWQIWVDSGLAPVQWLLSPWQELALWQKAVDSDADLSEILSPTRTLAKQGSSSYRKLCHWSISPQQLTEDLPSSRALKKWIANYTQQKNKLGAGDIGNLPDLLTQAWQSNEIATEKKIVLCGFESIAPAYSKLLSRATTQLLHVSTEKTPATCMHHTRMHSREDEILAFAQWARDTLQNEKTAKIALVVQDLSSRRNEIERQLMQVLDPHYLLPETEVYTAPINFSAGMSLAEQPLIYSALQILRLLQPKWPMQILLYLLHSPFWFDNIDANVRAKIERIWRKEKRESLNASHAIHVLSLDNDMTSIVSVLQHFKAPADLKMPSQWADYFINTLTAANWPGSRRLNSVEYQQAEQWQKCLNELSSLDIVLGSIHLQTALLWVNDIARSHNFQPKTAQSPIQVLGLLEASGLHFTHLWLCGMSAKEWPPAPSPDPLLPVALQRQHEMPHASFDREYIYAKNLTQGFMHSTKTLVCSYSASDEENHAEISHLLSFMPEISSEKIFIQSPKNPATTELQIIDTSTAPPVSDMEIKQIKGGYRLLETQITCPFTAFAKFRLGVEVLEEPEHSISAQARGNTIHKIMELFFANITNSANLKLPSSIDVLQACIKKMIDTQINRNPEFKNAWRVEKKRLETLLAHWVRIEMQRTDFTVAAYEQEKRIELRGLPITLRVDRIDKLPDGSHLLIDYKTGKNDLRSQAWLDEPPTDPQLPLYAAQYDNISGIAWGHIRSKKPAYIGIGKSENIPGLPKPQKNENAFIDAQTWSAQIENWLVNLQEVATQFMNGESAICDNRNENSHWEALKRLPEMDSLAVKKIT